MKHKRHGGEADLVAEAEGLRSRSGVVQIDSKLVNVLYSLMRDHIPPGVLERLVGEADSGPVTYTNGWLAEYAKDLADRLK